MTIEILLTKNQITVIDDVDSDLAEFKWQAAYAPTINSYYVQRGTYINKKNYTVIMHRIILSRILGRELLSKEQVDHKDLNSLNNRRENLRLAEHTTNGMNRGRRSDNTSGYKGVSWYARGRKWHAQISIEGKVTHLGYFENIEDAAEAYKQAAIKYHGEFARWD